MKVRINYLLLLQIIGFLIIPSKTFANRCQKNNLAKFPHQVVVTKQGRTLNLPAEIVTLVLDQKDFFYCRGERELSQFRIENILSVDKAQNTIKIYLERMAHERTQISFDLCKKKACTPNLKSFYSQLQKILGKKDGTYFIS